MHTRSKLGRPNGAYRRLAEVGGFQKLSVEDRSVATMRHDIAGLTLYADSGHETDTKQSSNRHNYVLAFESEKHDCQQIELTILKTSDPQTIWRMLELINRHAHRMQRELAVVAKGQCACGDDRCGARAVGPHDLVRIGGFDKADTREPIETTLAALTETPIDDGYAGFVNAVCSTVDAWLTSQSLWAPARHCSDASNRTESSNQHQ